MTRQSEMAEPVGVNPVSLDAAEIYGRLDPEGLRGRIATLPDQIEQAWTAARALELPAAHRACERVAVLGMGGSGIGGALLRALALEMGAKAPVEIVRGYRLPTYVDHRTLVLASSNSGNTEETVATFEQAVAAGAPCVAIATGGRLLEAARAANVPALTFEWDAEPRSALGWSFASLLAICGSAGLLPDADGSMQAALDEARAFGRPLLPETPEASNPAKQLARRLLGRLPAFVGAEAMAPVAYRWRTQVNENAKSWAIADELPEMNHNAQAGYGLPMRVVPLLHVVFLLHDAAHPRIPLRIEATHAELSRSGVSSEVVEIDGRDALSQMLRAILLGDWTSYYLGLLNGVHPSPVEPLDRIKEFLRKRP